MLKKVRLNQEALLFFNIYLFIYLSELGLGCGMQDIQSSLWRVGPSAAACRILVVACGI